MRNSPRDRKGVSFLANRTLGVCFSRDLMLEEMGTRFPCVYSTLNHQFTILSLCSFSRNSLKYDSTGLHCFEKLNETSHQLEQDSRTMRESKRLSSVPYGILNQLAGMCSIKSTKHVVLFYPFVPYVVLLYDSRR